MDDNLYSSIIDKINLINVISNNDENKYNHNNMYDQLINIQKNDSIRIYSNNIYNDRKQYKTIVKDLNRSWPKLSTNHKIQVILSFLDDFSKNHPKVNLNLIRYDTILNIDTNKGINLSVDYDSVNGKINKIYKYYFDQENNKVIKTDDETKYISNKCLIKLKLKSDNI